MAKNLTTLVKSISEGGGFQYNQHIWDFIPGTQAACACGYGGNRSTFCVPPGMSTATFHIWGAGGYVEGHQASACGFSVGGGSGAYAYQTVAVTPGQCYTVKAGHSHCCYPYPQTWGATPENDSDHGTTFVQGTGLTNFCAEGGFHTSFVCCTTTNFDTTLVDSAVPYYEGGDSALGPNRACYYGAIDGSRGNKSYVTENSVGMATCLSNLRYWSALPACSVYAKLGGHIQTGGVCAQPSVSNISRCFATNADQGYCGGVRTSEAQNWDLAGVGGHGVSACTTVCCGALNRAGKIRVFYSQELIWLKI